MAEYNWADLKKSAEDAGFSVVPKGTYNVVVSKSSAVKTSNGKDQIKVVFKILDGPHAGKPVNNNFTISPENPVAMGFFFRHMNALGLGSDYFANNPTAPMSQVANDILNRNCQVDVSVEKWNDEDRNRVNSVKSMPNALNAAVGVSMNRPAMPQPNMPTQPQPVAQPKATVAEVKAVAAEDKEDAAAAAAAAPAKPKLPF